MGKSMKESPKTEMAGVIETVSAKHRVAVFNIVRKPLRVLPPSRCSNVPMRLAKVRN